MAEEEDLQRLKDLGDFDQSQFDHLLNIFEEKFPDPTISATPSIPLDQDLLSSIEKESNAFDDLDLSIAELNLSHVDISDFFEGSDTEDQVKKVRKKRNKTD